MHKRYLRFPGFKLKAFTMSYDDGVRQDKRLVAIMKKYGLKGTFNLNSSRFNSDPNYTEEKGAMSESEVIALFNDDSTEVAVHGYDHLSLAEVPYELAVNDVLQDRKNLEKIFGKIVKGMAYANGSVNDNVVEILKYCGIKYSRTVHSTRSFRICENWLKLDPTCHHNDPMLNELTERFLSIKKEDLHWRNHPNLFYLWGHSYEFDNDNNWELIEEFAKKISNHDDIWYATNGELYDYIKAVDMLEFNVEANMIYNPTATTVYIDYMGKELIIKPGERVTF